MRVWIPRIIRYCLTLLLIYGAYTETGKWTAISLIGISIAIEILSWTKKERVR